MKAVVLAAGEGVRMYPLTDTRPKVMLPVADRPIAEHLVLAMREAGIEDFVFIVGYRAETVRDYFGSGGEWGVKIEYITQRRQLGTAHALRQIKGLGDEKFLLVNGDIMLKGGDIGRILARDTLTMGVAEVDDPRGLGVVEVDGERVVRIHEKVARPPSHLANAGAYLLDGEVLAAASKIGKSPRGEYEITDCLQLLIDEGRPISWEKLGFWFDIGHPWNLLSANESLMLEVKPENLGEVEENVVIKGPVAIGEGTAVKSGSYIEGPVVIGEDCRIGPNCYIRPGTAIGDRCHIGAAVEVKNSVVMRGSRIPHHNYVGDSIIGEDCNLGAGTKIANVRLDRGEIEVGGIGTGRQKLGAIVGDGVQTGINASINAGSLVGSYTFIGPGAVASGVIQPNSRIF
ncbi:MAG: bifunctional sugar-1-phosphate nucleotidylyltransferase/acetyltransferase [Dehalococcoidia bacterium]